MLVQSCHIPSCRRLTPRRGQLCGEKSPCFFRVSREKEPGETRFLFLDMAPIVVSDDVKIMPSDFIFIFCFEFAVFGLKMLAVEM